MIGKYIKRPPIGETRIKSYNGTLVTYTFLSPIWGHHSNLHPIWGHPIWGHHTQFSKMGKVSPDSKQMENGLMNGL